MNFGKIINNITINTSMSLELLYRGFGAGIELGSGIIAKFSDCFKREPKDLIRKGTDLNVEGSNVGTVIHHVMNTIWLNLCATTSVWCFSTYNVPAQIAIKGLTSALVGGLIRSDACSLINYDENNLRRLENSGWVGPLVGMLNVGVFQGAMHFISKAALPCQGVTQPILSGLAAAITSGLAATQLSAKQPERK